MRGQNRKSLKRPTGLRLPAAVALVWLVLGLGVALAGEPQSKTPRAEKEAAQYEPLHEGVPWIHEKTKRAEPRSLEIYYARRFYPGSPPVIPHAVEGAARSTGRKCLTCHARGGFVKTQNVYAPVTPHPEKVHCRQCHVPAKTQDLFRGNEWKSVEPPRRGDRALPGGPLRIPHSLQMRGNCLACHGGTGTPEAIRTTHPERTQCRQCHVPRKRAVKKETNGPWVRKTAK